MHSVFPARGCPLQSEENRLLPHLRLPTIEEKTHIPEEGREYLLPGGGEGVRQRTTHVVKIVEGRQSEEAAFYNGNNQ